jgi:hypothetical protein
MLFMRFAWMVKPRNYLLLSCHACNEAVQAAQLSRKVLHDQGNPILEDSIFKHFRAKLQ